MSDRPKNWMQLARYIENTLGVDLQDRPGIDPRRAQATAASILKKTAAKRGVTVDDLVAATNWMRRNRKKANHVCAVFYFLEHEVDTREVEGDISDEGQLGRALAREQAAAAVGDPEAGKWILRLSRTRGSALLEALVEWEAERG